MAMLSGKTVVLGVTGSIAAYKSAVLARLLVGDGARVIPVLTRSATRFIGAVTFAGITQETPRVDMWDADFPGELHVELAARADAILVVPATADVLARMAAGRADDLVTAVALCGKSPVLVAPAMHPRMWAHPATQRNVATLVADGVRFVGPVEGPVASGDVGMGRMAEPDAILAALREALAGDLAGLHVVVTAGPTFEAIDPVRFVGNRSSGTMGFRVAERAQARGARVTLIAGPVTRPTPPGVTRVDVRSAADMREALEAALPDADALVMSAAVADYRPKAPSAAKMKRDPAGVTLDLVANPDILAEIGARRSGASPVLVGFALETAEGDALVQLARGKLAKKKVDLVVANAARVALGGESNEAVLVTAGGADELGKTTKTKIADRILDFVRGRVGVAR